MKSFSPSELSKHVGTRFAEDERPSSDRMLIAVDDYVYDLTAFEDMHPGGAAVLKMHAGTDCTEQFYALHNKAVLDKYHDKLCVGVLSQGSEPPPSDGDLKLPEKDAEELISTVPYAEIPLMRESWANQPWWKESHREFLMAMRKILVDLNDEFFEIERGGQYVPLELQQRMGKMGILACMNGLSVMNVAQSLCDQGKMSLPGGVQPKDFDLWHEYVANQEFARSVPVGVRNGLSGGMAISLPAVAQFATNMPPAMKDDIVEQIILGNKRSCLAISEPQAGSDVAKLVTVAKKSKCGRFYIVNGIKKWITSGMNADFFSTAVRTGPAGAGGLSFLLVDKNHPKTAEGISLKHVKTSDSKAAATAWVYYDDCYVPVENLMGKENGGFKLMMANFNHERWLICAGVMGGIRMILQECFLWANQREVFGQKLIKQPVIRHKIGRMIGGVEALEGYLESITFQMANMDSMAQMIELGGALAILKYQTTRTMTMISDEACQIFGGRALTASGMGKNIENIQRTFKFASILGGSEEIMADLGVRQAMLSFPEDARL